MGRYRLGFILLCLLAPHPSVSEDASQRILWGNLVDMVIPVGQEQMISIDPPSDIEVGIPVEIKNQIQLLNTPGRLFLTANKAFEKQKIAMRHHKYGTTLINVSARQGVSKLHYIFTLPSEPIDKRHTVPKDACRYHYIELARWVLHHLYAPQRILKDHHCFTRGPIADVDIDLFECRHTHLCGQGAKVTLLASWQTVDGIWAYALSVKNNTSRKIVLDPRDIYYHRSFIAVVFAHGWLDRVDSMQDNTTAVLITTARLEASLPAARQFVHNRSDESSH